jgi:hypothetical protein
MTINLELIAMMHGVDHLEASIDYYRELGLIPIWWPDEDCVVLSSHRDRPPSLVLSGDTEESLLGASGLFAIDGLDMFFRRHQNLDWLVRPTDRAIGRYGVLADRTGTPLRLVEHCEFAAALAKSRPLEYDA